MVNDDITSARSVQPVNERKKVLEKGGTLVEQSEQEHWASVGRRANKEKATRKKNELDLIATRRTDEKIVQNGGGSCQW